MGGNGFFRLTAGIMIGYCLAQGWVYLNQNFFWTLFYR